MFDKKVSIEVRRRNGRVSSVKVMMPTWSRIGDDGKTYISAPFLGIDTYGVDEEDAKKSVESSIKNLIKGSEEFGKGFEEELIAMGWEKANGGTFSLTSGKQAIDSLINSGQTYDELLEVA